MIGEKIKNLFSHLLATSRCFPECSPISSFFFSSIGIPANFLLHVLNVFLTMSYCWSFMTHYCAFLVWKWLTVVFKPAELLYQFSFLFWWYKKHSFAWQLSIQCLFFPLLYQVSIFYVGVLNSGPRKKITCKTFIQIINCSFWACINWFLLGFADEIVTCRFSFFVFVFMLSSFWCLQEDKFNWACPCPECWLWHQEEIYSCEYLAS